MFLLASMGSHFSGYIKSKTLESRIPIHTLESSFVIEITYIMTRYLFFNRKISDGKQVCVTLYNRATYFLKQHTYFFVNQFSKHIYKVFIKQKYFQNIERLCSYHPANIANFFIFLQCTFKNSNFRKFCWVIRTQLKLFLL